MKTMLKKVICWFYIGRAFILALPFAIISCIITNIKHESDEAYVRRAFRMLPGFLKEDLTEDQLVNFYQDSRNK